MVPSLASLVSDPQWLEWLNRLVPVLAGLTVQTTVGLDRLPVAPWAGLGVLAGYAGAALLLGAILFRARDA